jgi:hypothetical protein
MEKLQELLKEYQLSKWEWVRLAWPDVDVNDKEELVLEATLMSKKYGFIKWLVDNHKIRIWEFDNYVLRKCWDFNWISDYDGILMVLSIQDEPIEFLVSILK